MISNFPYIKVKNNNIAFVTSLDDMKYNFLGQSNGFTITRFLVENDPYEDKDEFENLIMQGRGFIEAQDIEVELAKEKMNLSSKKRSNMNDNLRKFFSDKYVRWTGTLLLRYAIMVKSSVLRQYEPVPVTFIPGFNSFSMADRFVGRSDFNLSREMKKFILVSPKIEPITYDFDIDLDPQRYINETVKQENSMDIQFYDLDLELMKLKPFKHLKIDFSYKELYYDDDFMIFLILGKKYNSIEIWAIKKNFTLIKLYEMGFDNLLDGEESEEQDDQPFHRKVNNRFELDFSKGSTRCKIEDFVLYVTFTLKHTLYMGEIDMMVRDIGFDRKHQAISREIGIDLRKFEGLIYQNQNNGFEEGMCWKDKVNIIKW